MMDLAKATVTVDGVEAEMVQLMPDSNTSSRADAFDSLERHKSSNPS